VKLSAEVEAWFKAKQHPQEKAIRRVLVISLGADPQMRAWIQYGSLNFGYENAEDRTRGMLAAFVQVAKKSISLMFGNGAKIPGKFPHLEGSGPNARLMRFKDIAEVEARAGELRRIAAAWCKLKSGAAAE